MKILEFTNVFRNKPTDEIQSLVTQGYAEACLELIYRSPLNDDGTGKNFEVTAEDAWAAINFLTQDQRYQPDIHAIISAIKTFQYYKEGKMDEAYSKFCSLQDCKEIAVINFLTTYEKAFHERKIDHLLKAYSSLKSEAIQCKKDKMKHDLYIKAHIALLEALQVAQKLDDKLKGSEKVKYIQKNYIIKTISKYMYKEDVHNINQNSIEYFYVFLLYFLFQLQKSKIQNEKRITIGMQIYNYQFDTFKTHEQTFKYKAETVSIITYYLNDYPHPHIYSRHDPYAPNEEKLLSCNDNSLTMPYYFEKYFFEETLNFIKSAHHHSLLSQNFTFSLMMSLAKIKPHNDYYNDKINHILFTIFYSTSQISMANYFFNLISSTYTEIKPQEIISVSSPLTTTDQKDKLLYACFKKAAHKALINKDNSSLFTPNDSGLNFTKITPKAIKHAFAFLNIISHKFNEYDHTFIAFLELVDAKDFDILTQKRSILSRFNLPDLKVNALHRAELPVRIITPAASEQAKITDEQENNLELIEQMPSKTLPIAANNSTITIANKEQDFTTALLSLKKDANQQTILITSLLNTTLRNLQEYLIEREKRRSESVSNRFSFFLSDVFSNETENRTQFVRDCETEINQHLTKLRQSNSHNYKQILNELRNAILIIKQRFPGVEMIKIYEATERRINEFKTTDVNDTPNPAA